MPGQKRILPLAISAVLMAPAIEAHATWDCTAADDGSWSCLKDGVLVAPQAPSPAIKGSDPTTAATTPAQPVTKSAVTPATAPQPAVTQTPAPPARPAPRPEPEVVVEPKPTPPPRAKKPEPDKAPEAVVTQQPQPAIKPAPPARHEATAAPQPAAAPAVETKKVVEVDNNPPSPSLAEATIQGFSVDIDQGINWESCNQPQSPPPSTSTSIGLPEGTTLIEADGAELFRKKQLTIFTGDVEVTQGEDRLKAEEIHYHREQSEVDTIGRGYLEQKGFRMTGTDIHYNLDSRQGHSRDVDYRLLDRTARGTATEAVLDNPKLSHYKEVSYSTCRPEKDDWIIKADELELDQTTGVGTARNATLAFMGVPFFYTPYFTFPIDDRRKSGFLAPSIGSGDNTGFDFSVPYYFNIAPNMDATVTPRYMSKRGLLLGGEFRFLAKKFQGQVKGELLPSDSDRGAGENETRGALQVRLNGTPAPRWSYEVSTDYVSDSDYLDDLGKSLAATSTSHQERRGDITYHGDGWNLLSRIQSYQTVDNSIALSSRPYSRLPQLKLDLSRPDQWSGLDFHLNAEYVNFDHESSSKVKGQRIDVRPAVSLPLRKSWGYLTPKLALSHTQYSLTDQGAGISSSQSRTLPTLSIDSGLFFDRETNWFGESAIQTLEPRLYYLYTPYEDQSSLPVFDTSALGFSFGNLFAENRFSGPDRVGDANQVTAALTTRTLMDKSGKQMFRASIGQTYYFRDRDVQMPGTASADDSSSSTAAELAATLSDNLRLTTDLQWSPHNNAGIEKTGITLNYLDDQQRILNLSYRFTDNSLEQLDLSGRWPVSHNLSLVGRWNHSLLHDQLLEAFAGIEYDSCCWTTRLVARQHRTSATAEATAAIFLQLELKGLTSIGDRLDQFLEKGVLGYQAVY